MATLATPVALRAQAAPAPRVARRAFARAARLQSRPTKAFIGRGLSLRVRAEATESPVGGGPAADTELEAVAAAVEALRLENEKLRQRLQTDGEIADVAVAAPRRTGGYVKKDFSSFEYPPVHGDGWGIMAHDNMLNNHRDHLGYRWHRFCELRKAIDQNEGGLEKFSRGYEKMGFTKTDKGITYREWAPAAQQAYLFGDFNGWNTGSHRMEKDGFGVFQIFLPNNPDGTLAIPHGSRVKVHLQGPGGDWIDRIPAWIKYAVQAPGEILFNGVYYDPPPEETHVFEHARPKTPKALRIYEAHVGMSSIEPKISSYNEFRDTVLPRVKYLGYNAIQLMAIQEHAYYACFGYHVTNFFAVSSRCGTPDDLKALIDRAHELGILVLMDIVHSHASSNSNDGINMFDGSDGQYFHSGPRGYHWMWDSRCFNYGNWEVLRFLLSNLRYWIEEFNFDGFRFDGVTSMMYTHHGLSVGFTGNYKEYFGMATDTDAMVYLMLANDMLHTLYPGEIVTVAEDVSGMPTLCRPVGEGGVGFDYRLQMAIADKWIEVLGKWGADENWDLGNLVFTMENRRYGEKCIGYAESHDQALVGDKTIAFWLMDAAMYDGMSCLRPAAPVVERGVALHKMIRAFTMGLGGEGYLNFMGNEFGHPEWIDFPREDRVEASTGKFIPGNGGSYHLCRRRADVWRFDLADMDHLRYKFLYAFDAALNSAENVMEWLSSGHQWVSKKCNNDKVVVFERGDAVFVFNWHPTQSYTGYRVGCKDQGKYKILLNSDSPTFGGWGNVKDETEFYTQHGHDNRPHSLMVYAPARTVVVYAPAHYLEKANDPLEEFCDANPSEAECLVYDETA